MKKGILRSVIVTLCLLMLLGSLSVCAAQIDTSHPCSLTLTYAKGDVIFPGLKIHLYRIAEMENVGAFQKVSPFDGYPIELLNVTSQTEWNEIAATLRGYVQADGIVPYRTQTTDQEGRAVFSNIETGLYLVSGAEKEIGDTLYTFYDFMITLPGAQDDTITYDVAARPKSEQSEPTEQEKEYTILKLWKDDGNSHRRPTSVTVDILKDGALAETVVLDAANDWTYTFTCPDGKGRWSAVERNVPAGYTVKVTERDTAFVIVNAWSEPGPDSPDTGDTLPWRFGIAVLCIAGLAAVIFGVALRRNDDASKK